MHFVTADDKWLSVLSQAKELTEIRDTNGKIVGYFAPLSVEHAASFASYAAQADARELQRRKETGQATHTTAEVLARLKEKESV